MSVVRLDLLGDVTPRMIATRLSRVPRFNGQTIVPWSVLHHTLVGYGILADTGLAPLVKLVWALHDSEEGWTGDTPRPFKSDEQRELGEAVRVEIFRRLQVPYDTATLEALKDLDDAVAAAEAEVLCDPAYRVYFDPGVANLHSGRVWALLDMDAREAIHTYTEIVDALLVEPSIRSMRNRL